MTHISVFPHLGNKGELTHVEMLGSQWYQINAADLSSHLWMNTSAPEARLVFESPVNTLSP